MNLHTKYVGRPFICRRCNRKATERWWWTRNMSTPVVLRVAYFCGISCAENYAGYEMHPNKQSIMASVLADIIIGE